MFSFLYVNSSLGYWYIIWKVNTRNSGMNLRNTLCTNMPLGQVNRQWLDETMHVACHSCYICDTWRSKDVGGLKLWYGGKGKSHKQEKLLQGRHKKTTQGVDHWTTLPGLLAYFSVKRYMHYIRFLLTKNS